jgi:hypothetical protein
MKKTSFHKGMTAQHEIFHGVETGEELNVLKSPRDTQLCDMIRLLPLDFLPIEGYSAPVRTIDPIDAIKKSRFARTIGPYDGKNVAFMDLEIDIYEGFQTSKRNGEVFNLE